MKAPQIAAPQWQMEVTYTWVKGLKDTVKDSDSLTQHERLNIWMESLMAQAHHPPHCWWSSSACHIYPGECWGIFLHDHKITSGLRNTLIEAFQEAVTIQYLKMKYGFLDPVFVLVSWHHFETLMQNQPTHQRASFPNISMTGSQPQPISRNKAEKHPDAHSVDHKMNPGLCNSMLRRTWPSS